MKCDDSTQCQNHGLDVTKFLSKLLDYIFVLFFNTDLGCKGFYLIKLVRFNSNLVQDRCRLFWSFCQQEYFYVY